MRNIELILNHQESFLYSKESESSQIETESFTDKRLKINKLVSLLKSPFYKQKEIISYFYNMKDMQQIQF